MLLLLAALVLPAAAERVLDREYSGWQLAPVAPQIREWFEDRRFDWQPNLGAADFDRDGQRDYAALILAGGREHSVVLLARGDSFELKSLASDPPDPFLYLLMNRTGDRDFSFETMRAFRHVRDSLNVMYFDRTPLQFTWVRGRFEKRLVLNDEERD